MPSSRPAFGKPAKRPLISGRSKRSLAGIMSIVVLLTIGAIVASLIQVGMTLKYEASPEVFNDIFIALGFPGRMVEYAYQDGWYPRSFHAGQVGETLSIATNAIVYFLFLLYRLYRRSDDELKKR